MNTTDRVLAFAATTIVAVVLVLFRPLPASADGDADIGAPPSLDTVLTVEEIGRDLDELQRIIDEEWLLSNLNDADHDAAIATLREKSNLSIAYFNLEVQKLLACSGDGHAKVGSLHPSFREVSNRTAPFGVEPVGDRYIATDPSSNRRSQLWNADYPFVTAIDGVGIEKWVAAAVPYFPRSNPLANRVAACIHLRYVGYFRSVLHMDDPPTFQVTLESSDGRRKTLTVDGVTHERFSLLKYNLFLKSLDRRWTVLDGNIGYLWLPNPAADGVEQLIEAMPRLRNTQGLVVDLRNNEGGAGTEALSVLGTWLAGAESPRQVVAIERGRAGLPVAANVPVYAADSPELTSDGRQ
ncbi:MAG: S41 family peptidase, partial [Planctomycetota bacterium]|nr:S41 family peptidase [Planctomycetota bacterium]